MIEQLDPRRHLAAAIGWAVFVIVVLASLAAAEVAATAAEQRTRADIERLITEFAIRLREGLDLNLATRLSIVRASAAHIEVDGSWRAETLRRHMDAVRMQFPEFAWLGVVDASGHIVASSGELGLADGSGTLASAWLQQGSKAGLDGAGAVGGAASLSVVGRTIDIAAPVRVADGAGAGVMGARLRWSWIERVEHHLLGAIHAPRTLEVLISTHDGTIGAGPAQWVGRTIVGADLSEGGLYLVGRDTRRAVSLNGPRMSVIVRQRARAALESARAARRAVFIVVILAGLVSALSAVVVTRMLTRRLAGLARDAQAVRDGASIRLTVPKGRDEVGRIGAVMSELVDHLQREKQALSTLNDELDRRVAERSARIEGLSRDARRAAVASERLRIARDLHDTLAHSLMALLTQIRLIRKLGPGLGPAALAEELGRAEEAASGGLAEARTAIRQMRDYGIQDAGLGAALQGLLGRFAERTDGLRFDLDVDRTLAASTDEGAQTALRIAEEVLRNVERHAQALHLRIKVDEIVKSRDPTPGTTRLRRMRIEDDGVGFDPESVPGGHFGLTGMREQAALIGASLEIRSSPGAGTVVILLFPA
ncbi:MAG: histidine kinase [Burkholderiaceae bacterium]